MDDFRIQIIYFFKLNCNNIHVDCTKKRFLQANIKHDCNFFHEINASNESNEIELEINIYKEISASNTRSQIRLEISICR